MVNAGAVLILYCDGTHVSSWRAGDVQGQMAAKVFECRDYRSSGRSLAGTFDAAVVAGAKPAPFPGFGEPCHPTLREQAPPGVRWIHEIKFDGYRTRAHLRNGRPAIYTRRACSAAGKTHDHAPAWIELKDIAQSGSGRKRGIDGEET